jgi:hypothetical protein
MNKLTLAALLALAAPLALAKLPAPALDDAAKAKAAEAAAKTAWQGKVDTFQLCKSQDKVAAHYRKTSGQGAKPAPGKTAAPAAAATACADPGPFAYTPPAQKPLEASGAHSPPGTASSPPSTKTPAAKKG